VNRNSVLACAVAVVALAPAGSAALATAPQGSNEARSAPQSWDPIETRASASGDSVYLVERNDDGVVRFRVRIAAEYYQRTKVCVRKLKAAGKGPWVCRTVRMKPTGAYSVHQGKITWQGHYPSKGMATRQVRFGGPGGVKLRFDP
jgi:hypothetical protein